MFRRTSLIARAGAAGDSPARSSLILQLSSRLVATTSSSKSTQQQVARQRKQTAPRHEPTEQEQEPEPLSWQKCQARLDHFNLWHSIDTIKRLGHRMAALDPLGLSEPQRLEELTWSHSLVSKLKSSSEIVPTHAFLETKQPLMAVGELLDAVLSIYASNQCGLEFAHITNQDEVEWLTSQWERLNEMHHLDYVDQQNFAKLMLECEAFDHFMAAKFATTKRYGCEGAESMLVALDEILRLCHLGDCERDDTTRSIGKINDVIIGMPHRGRLNLLACLLNFDPAAIFSKTRGEPELELRAAWMAKGDVLSHLSTNVRFVYGLERHNVGLSRDTPEPINVSLLPNPSHLEVASPLAAGSARGRAHNHLHGYSSSPKFTVASGEASGEPSGGAPPANCDYSQHFSTILPIQVHGDASVAGQGIIQETLQMANLAKFTVGGSLHLVLNNQLGFTTGAEGARSSRHCTDIFKLIEAPIVHVNAQNVASVVRATRLALAYRQRFAKDVVIDLVCYRQHGHNEMDEPSLTQPLMYKRIKSRKSIPQSYCDQIGLEPERRKRIANAFRDRLQEAHKRSLDTFKPDNDNYRNFELASEYHRDHIVSWQTGCQLELLRSIALASVETPPGFRLHPNLERVLVAERRQRFSSELPAAAAAATKVDWATAEILALGSLLSQNHSVRIAGQDVARGTFSTRHAVLFDQDSGAACVPLNNMQAGNTARAQLEVASTILSEEAALAYEFGYSAETCELSIWEAQFGDFCNTAQSILDTLVSSSEAKWLRQSPLTILLPHGLDGAGPEHSSARLERLLQMSSSATDSIDTEAKVNWSVCYPTQPKQYFHLLRRQILRPFRKPLVVIAPKLIFRHPDCVSELADFGPDKTFEPVLDDPSVAAPEQVDTVVLCTGKVYFALQAEKSQHKLDNLAILRIEELCPFPVQSIAEIISSRYPHVRRQNFVWLQEEHKNQGAYAFVNDRLANIAGIRMRYLGRPESELPAVGISSLHKKELDHLMRQFRSLGGK